jgi:hypothetical protein
MSVITFPKLLGTRPGPGGVQILNNNHDYELNFWIFMLALCQYVTEPRHALCRNSISTSWTVPPGQ